MYHFAGSAYGAQVDLHYHYGYPPTINRDGPSVDRLHAAATKIVGGGSGVPYITCGAEDFAYFLEQKPGCFFFIGAALPGLYVWYRARTTSGQVSLAGVCCAAGKGGQLASTSCTSSRIILIAAPCCVFSCTSTVYFHRCTHAPSSPSSSSS